MWEKQNRNHQNYSSRIDMEIINNLIRNEEYLNNTYEVKETVSFSESSFKMFACTRDKFMDVIITKGDFINNEDILERLCAVIRLIEENVILVENIWINVEENQTGSESKKV
jgi:hypothetical protein